MYAKSFFMKKKIILIKINRFFFVVFLGLESVDRGSGKEGKKKKNKEYRHNLIKYTENIYMVNIESNLKVIYIVR